MKIVDKKDAPTEGAHAPTQTKKTALRILWGNLRKDDRGAGENDKIKFLKKFPFFQQLNKRQLSEVAQIIYERDYRENELLFDVGQPGAALFFIHSGEVSIEIRAEDGELHQVALLGKHSFVGEIALLDESPRSALARAAVPAKVFAFFKSDLDKLLDTEPQIAGHIYKALATMVGARLKATNELIEKKQKVAA
jgi:CRP/FNR family transcriptional regulator, cyclic AMP receptor protein